MVMDSVANALSVTKSQFRVKPSIFDLFDDRLNNDHILAIDSTCKVYVCAINSLHIQNNYHIRYNDDTPCDELIY